MIIISYILTISALLFLFLTAKTFYNIIEVFFFVTLLLAITFCMCHYVIVAMNAITLLIGCILLILATISEIKGNVCTEINDGRFKFLLRKEFLCERQKYFRVNCYVAVEGLLGIIFGVSGLLIPDTLFGIIQIK